MCTSSLPQVKSVYLLTAFGYFKPTQVVEFSPVGPNFVIQFKSFGVKGPESHWDLEKKRFCHEKHPCEWKREPEWDISVWMGTGTRNLGIYLETIPFLLCVSRSVWSLSYMFLLLSICLTTNSNRFILSPVLHISAHSFCSLVTLPTPLLLQHSYCLLSCHFLVHTSQRQRIWFAFLIYLYL